MKYSVKQAYKRYSEHKASAEQRSIVFRLAFIEWFRIWIESGKWHLRGCRKGQYVMARFNDSGPYAIGNVRIVKQEENHYEAHPNQVYRTGSHETLSLATRGDKNGNSKLSNADVLQIRNIFIDRSPIFGALALSKRYGVTTTAIHDIINNKSWKHLPATTVRRPPNRRAIKLTREQSVEIKKLYKPKDRGNFGLRGLGLKYGVNLSTIQAIVKGEIWN